jgi:ATPase subunit of ABC transporter with duplicated ATPase domains
MSASVVAHALRFRRGDAVILDGVSLTIGPRTRVGVIGDNGSGKTTLLRLLAGELHAERGTVKLAPPTATVGYLPQEAERGDGETVRALLHRRTGVTDADQALAHATHALAAHDEGADDLYSAALERWLALGGSDLDARIGVILADIGLPADALDQRTSTLSGGQAARVSLAAILLARFDVFLLDEPTNDLDFAGLDRLEEFVSSIAGGVAIVSHDRAFLERTITSVLEIDDVSHHATLHEGGWLAYLDARATARRHAEEAYADYTSKRDRLVDRGRRQKQWAAAGRRAVKRNPDPDKNVNAFRIASSEKQASKVKITDRALERLEVAEKPWEGWELHLELATAPRSGAVVFRLEDAVIERGAFRLGPLDLEIGWAERAAILGPNGCGKTTLLGALLGRVPLTAGTRWMGPGVVVGELDQARARLSTAEPVLHTFTAAAGLLPQEARALLAKFGLGAGDVERAGAALSPGERTRAELALLMARGTNCLVLDEPTNHLDLPAIEQLEQALDTWEGTLLLVTHDRRLLETVRVTRTIELSPPPPANSRE